MDGEKPGLHKAGEKKMLTRWTQICYRLPSSPIPCFPATTGCSASPFHFHHHLTDWHLSQRQKPSSSSLWWASLLFASPIANLSCTPPLYTVLIVGSHTHHSNKESLGWKQGCPCVKAFKSDSTQPTQARFQRWVWDSLILKSFNLFKSIFNLFNATCQLKYKTNPFALHLFDSSRNYSM